MGKIPWGSHFCHFYETRDDLLDILLSFFQAGLENNEFCMWITFDPLDEQQAADALRAAFRGAGRRLAAGDIEILPHIGWYLFDGALDVHRVIEAWKGKLAWALANGYSGMRVNGNENWLTKRDWKDFARYEVELNGMIAGEKMIVLCTYPLSVSKGSEVFDVADSHEFAIAKRYGKWEVIETAKLRQTRQELKELTDELENRVSERTQALQAATVQNRALSARLEQARETESARISREIHDQLGSALTTLKWDLEELEKRAGDSEHPPQSVELLRRTAAMLTLTDSTIANIRKIASELRPALLDDLGITAAVEWQAQRLSDQTGIVCQFECSFDGADLTPEQSTAVYRIVQEALTNIVRHSGAARSSITIEEDGGDFVLTVADNGKGITASEKSRRGSLGLWGMRERAHMAGGTIEITGSPQNGTEIVLRIPLVHRVRGETA